jgi:hypothetical protein
VPTPENEPDQDEPEDRDSDGVSVAAAEMMAEGTVATAFRGFITLLLALFNHSTPSRGRPRSGEGTDAREGDGET